LLWIKAKRKNKNSFYSLGQTYAKSKDLLTFRHKPGIKSTEETTSSKIKYSKELIVKELD